MTPDDIENAGADAIWAEVFNEQGNQQDMANDAIAAMEEMNAKADEINIKMKEQTEKYKENIKSAQDVQQLLHEGMAKLSKLSSTMTRDPILCGCTMLALFVLLAAVTLMIDLWSVKNPK